MNNHATNNCKWKGQEKCGICFRFGHATEDCYSRKAKALKRKRENKKGKSKGKKKRKKEEMNQGEEEDDEEDEDEHIACCLIGSSYSDIPLDESEIGQCFNFDESDVNYSGEYNPPLIYYDWLGDSATTAHVSNRCEAFKTFRPMDTKYLELEMLKLRQKAVAPLN